MQKKSIDTPLAEITLRRYEKPYNLKKRELVRKLCLSLGLLNPGDSRDIIVDILYILLDAKKEKKKLSSDEIREEVIKLRQNENLDLNGTAGSNIRRQIRQLRKAQLVEKIKNDYRISEFLDLITIYNEKIERYLLNSINERVKEYLIAVDNAFKKIDSNENKINENKSSLNNIIE